MRVRLVSERQRRRKANTRAELEKLRLARFRDVGDVRHARSVLIKR